MDADGVRKRLRKAIEAHDPPTAFAWCVFHSVAPSVASAFLAEKTATPAPSILAALGLEEIVRVRYARIMTDAERAAEREALRRWVNGEPMESPS